MVADSKPAEREWIENTHLAPRCAQRLPESTRQPKRANRIYQHPHSRAPLACPDQRFAKPLPQRIWHEDVGFQADRQTGSIDGREHRGKDFAPGA